LGSQEKSHRNETGKGRQARKVSIRSSCQKRRHCSTRPHCDGKSGRTHTQNRRMDICHAVRTRKEEKKKVMSFYLRAGGACFLYTHCQALSAPPFRFRRCTASVFAGPLSSGQVPIRRGASGKVLFRHGAGQHPAVVSKHTPPRNYPHSYAWFRVTIAPNFGCRPWCP